MSSSSDVDFIKTILKAYREGLVSSNVAAILSLYTKDGITMAQHSITQIGHEAIEAWYTQCFKILTLDVEFNIEEVAIASEKYAFARTTSSGTQKINATGQTSKESNQELFVMEKVGGEWKIARYCFCTMNAPK